MKTPALQSNIKCFASSLFVQLLEVAWLAFECAWNYARHSIVISCACLVHFVLRSSFKRCDCWSLLKFDWVNFRQSWFDWLRLYLINNQVEKSGELIVQNMKREKNWTTFQVMPSFPNTEQYRNIAKHKAINSNELKAAILPVNHTDVITKLTTKNQRIDWAVWMLWWYQVMETGAQMKCPLYSYSNEVNTQQKTLT